MRVTIEYTGRVEIEVDPADIADSLSGKKSVTDDMIRRAIAENVGEAATDREWPSYVINRDDMVEAIEAVKKEMT